MGVVLLSQVGPQREEVKGKESKAGSEIKVHHVDYLRSLFLCGRSWYLGQRSLPWLTLSLPLEDVSRGCHTSPHTSPPVTQASAWIHALPSSPSTSSPHGQLWAHSQSHGVLEPDHGFLLKKGVCAEKLGCRKLRDTDPDPSLYVRDAKAAHSL